MGFPIIHHPCCGTPILANLHIVDFGGASKIIRYILVAGQQNEAVIAGGEMFLILSEAAPCLVMG